jgi:hypothetical protein
MATEQFRNFNPKGNIKVKYIDSNKQKRLLKISVKVLREMRSEEVKMKKCDECNGTGKVECGECGGSQEVDCDGECTECGCSCNSMKSCPDCLGEGELNCEKCEGSGEVESD